MLMKLPIKSFVANYMKAEMSEAKDKFLFLVSDPDLCLNIITLSFRAVCVADESGLKEFANYMDGISCTGTQQPYFMYICSCSTKKMNDSLKTYFSNNHLEYCEGWQMFKDREYLKNPQYANQLKEILHGFIRRYEPDETELQLDEFHFMKQGLSGEAGATAPFDSKIRKHLLRHNNIFVNAGTPYIYRDGIYWPDFSGTKLKSMIEECLYPRFQKSHVIRQIYNLIIDTDELQRSFDELNRFPETYIFFKDCVLDAEKMEELPHDPRYLAINQVPYEWKKIKAAENGEEIEKFFSFIFSSADDRKMFLEFSGLCITRDTRQQRFLTLCGLGGTGKSVLIRLIEKSVGAENTSSVSMQELSKRFNTSQLVGKMLNSCADIEASILEDSSIMKKILGEDNLFCERKGKDGFTYRNYAKLIFSCNTLPVITSERTNGFFRRLLILEMNRRPEKPDTGLFAKLEQEISYFINLSVQALHEMYTRPGRIVTISENSKKAVQQMWEDSDSVEAWLSNCCTLDQKARLSRTDAFDSFSKYCESQGRQALAKNNFYRALRNKNFSEIRLHGYYHFTGIRVSVTTTPNSHLKTTPEGFMEVSQEELNSLPFT